MGKQIIEAKKFIEAIRYRFTKTSRNLVYFASGTDLKIIKEYYSSNSFHVFDNIVLVDFHHRINGVIDGNNITVWNVFHEKPELESFNNVYHFGVDITDPAEVKGNIICLRADATEAVDIFRKYGIKFDYFTVINEGWVHYPALNHNAFTAYALPIFKDEYFHFAWDEYWKYIKKLPFATKGKIEPEDPSYLEVYSQSDDEPRILVRLSGRINGSICRTFNKVKVCLIRKSIWEDADELDRIFISLRSTQLHEGCYWGKIKERNDKVAFMGKSNISAYQDLLTEADLSVGNKVVGFIPMGLKEHYQQVIDFINAYDFRNIKEIRFYHIDSNDFSDLYNLFGQKHPDLD